MQEQQERSPSDFLGEAIGRRVLVKLNSGVEYRGEWGLLWIWLLLDTTRSKPVFSALVGILSCLDGYMNIALEQTEEWVNGQLKNKYGDAFIRGNNGNYYNENTVYELVWYYSISLVLNEFSSVLYISANQSRNTL